MGKLFLLSTIYIHSFIKKYSIYSFCSGEAALLIQKIFQCVDPHKYEKAPGYFLYAFCSIFSFSDQFSLHIYSQYMYMGEYIMVHAYL